MLRTVNARRKMGRSKRQHARHEMKAALERNFGYVFLYTLLHIAVTTVAVFAIHEPFWRGIIIGGAVGLYAVVWVLFSVKEGVTAAQIDGDVEVWTSKQLTLLDPKQWLTLHDLDVYGSGHIPHVAVGNGRVCIIESVWVPNSEDKKAVKLCALAAEDAAKRVAHFLNEQKVSTPCTPIVAVWGPKTETKFSNVYTNGRAKVVGGDHLQKAISNFENITRDAVTDAEVYGLLADKHVPPKTVEPKTHAR